MALQGKLDRFKKQQEKCQSTLSSIAANKAVSASVPNALAPAKFSTDTERLQHINSIRKAPVGAQMKRVIDLLFEVSKNTNMIICNTHMLYYFYDYQYFGLLFLCSLVYDLS